VKQAFSLHLCHGFRAIDALRPQGVLKSFKEGGFQAGLGCGDP
jgi:hypothetical protein